jgi:hypothetical protein
MTLSLFHGVAAAFETSGKSAVVAIALLRVLSRLLLGPLILGLLLASLLILSSHTADEST